MSQTESLVNLHTIHLGNQLYEVDLKLQFKRRQLGFNLSILCARYEIEIPDYNNIWMISFIIPEWENDVEQFLVDFAWTFLLTDHLLNRLGLHHLCRFQNRLGQENIDEELKADQEKFQEEMKKRRIILLEDNDTVISQWQVFQPKDFVFDPKSFRYSEQQDIISVLNKLNLKT